MMIITTFDSTSAPNILSVQETEFDLHEALAFLQI